jgi:hypothetical protein
LVSEPIHRPAGQSIIKKRSFNINVFRSQKNRPVGLLFGVIYKIGLSIGFLFVPPKRFMHTSNLFIFVAMAKSIPIHQDGRPALSCDRRVPQPFRIHGSI